MNGFPSPTEYAPYYFTYIGLVPADTDIRSFLNTQEKSLFSFFKNIPSEKHDYRYAEGKWSVKEVVGHILDTERIMAYRALRVGRGDTTPIEGFEQDDYVPAGKFAARKWEDLLHEFSTVRQSTLSLVNTMPDEAFTQMGTANGKPVSCRALFYIIAGHALYHRQILEQKYL
ncbi:MAG: DinB family protein [Bacteroidia bacterium]|nr:DinB family protein [Bacteroidia bacterium]